MPPVHGVDTVVWLGGRDLTSHMRMADVSHNQEALDTTVFGERARTFTPGLCDATVSLEGLFDRDGDEELQNLHESADSFVWSTGQDGLIRSGLCINTGLVRAGTVAELVTVSFDMQCTEALDDHGRAILSGGVVLYDGVVSSGSASGAAVDLGVTTADLALALQIAVPSASGTLRVQTSASSGFSSSANVLTVPTGDFSSQGGVILESSTNTQRYVRLAWVGAASAFKLFAALHVL